MARAKSKTIKSKDEVEEKIEDVDSVDIDPIKSKKDPIVALDEHVEVEVPEEKVEDDIPVKAVEEEEELLSDEVSLDDEELNPFGDKWEE